MGGHGYVSNSSFNQYKVIKMVFSFSLCVPLLKKISNLMAVSACSVYSYSSAETSLTCTAGKAFQIDFEQTNNTKKY